METNQIISESLKKMARGTSIFFAGTIAGMALSLIARVILVRYITQSEYGIYTLALALATIFSLIASLGLPQGATRYIAYYRGRNELSNIRGIVFSSLWFSLTASILLSLILFFLSDILANKIFDAPELSTPLKIFSVIIPFLVLNGIFTTIFRGFDRVDVKVYFQDIIKGVLFPIFLALVIILGSSFLGVIYAYSVSVVVTFVAYSIYTMKRSPLPKERLKSSSPTGKELLLFSLPLLGISMLYVIIQWTDVIMLGYFKTSTDVGLYNGALPLVQLILIPLTSLAFIYVPVVSQLYARGLMNDMKRSYQVLTKWIFSLSFPLALIMLFFPEAALNFFFGFQYMAAASALRILCIGYTFSAFLGLNSGTLIVMGKTRLLLWATLIGATLNVALNAVLIPPLGITGAAIASLVSLFAMNIFSSVKLYQLSKIQPFTKNYLKPVIISGLIIFAIYIVGNTIFTVTFWLLPLFFILFLAVYSLSLILTKSFDNEDIMLLLTIEKRMGLNLAPIKNILRRFI